MGIDYCILGLETNELYELGGDAWRDLNLTDNTKTISEFAQHVLDCWNKSHVEPGNEKYMFKVGHEIWRWCEDRDWKVKLVSDHDGDSDTWVRYPKVRTICQLL